MTAFNWKLFLAGCSQELATRNQLLDWTEVPQAACDEHWFGFPPATDDEIDNAERSLKIQLPDDSQLESRFLDFSSFMFQTYQCSGSEFVSADRLVA